MEQKQRRSALERFLRPNQFLSRERKQRIYEECNGDIEEAKRITKKEYQRANYNQNVQTAQEIKAKQQEREKRKEITCYYHQSSLANTTTGQFERRINEILHHEAEFVKTL